MDILTIAGLVFGFAAIIGGQVLEGGTLHSIMQFTAAIIVLGGTIGAVLVNYSMPTFLLALKNLRKAFFNGKDDPKAVIKEIAELAGIARKDGLLALEARIKALKDPFLKKGLQLIVDGTEPKLTREILEIDVAYSEEYNSSSAKVFESAGGYAPTIGILGAVLGLIHVMENLAEPDKLGSGIAVAFVATIYGVAFANLLFLPVANKLKSILMRQSDIHEMIVDGLAAIASGENPRLVELKLQGYLE